MISCRIELEGAKLLLLTGGASKAVTVALPEASVLEPLAVLLAVAAACEAGWPPPVIVGSCTSK